MLTITGAVGALAVCGSVLAGTTLPTHGRAESQSVAVGVDYEAFRVPTSHGTANVHLVIVDLDQPGVRAGLLYPGSVTGRQSVEEMAEQQGAVAAINGDFFDISEDQHHGVAATGSTTGPELADGVALKAAVPQGQRYGIPPPPGGSDREVFGVGLDGTARTARLTLRGRVLTPRGSLPLGGLNQYALPVNSVGVFTHAWGTVSRARAVCGTDDDRGAPCSRKTREVTVRAGRVSAVSDTIGGGPIPPGTVVLVGRGNGADRLRDLDVGSPVFVDYGLDSTSAVPFAFALGANRLLAHHRPFAGLDNQDAEPRSAVGIADEGHTLFLLSTDGREGTSSGLTVRELAEVLESLNCEQGVYLDGGSSATLVTRDPISGRIDVRNRLDGRRQRPVPNGIAIYAATLRLPEGLLSPLLSRR